MPTVKFEKWLEPENLYTLAKYAKEGLTDAQISKLMGISNKTLRIWKKEHPIINDVLVQNKECIDHLVVSKLLSNAVGYTAREIKKEYDADGNLLKIITIEKDVPPNTTAQIFWLKNRQPELWRNMDYNKPVSNNSVIISGEDEIID